MRRRAIKSLRPRHDESGAVLLLALIFVIVMSVALLAIVNFAGDALLNTANLKGDRSLQYAADAATDAAIETVRYSYYAFDGTNNNPPGGCLPDGAVLAVPDAATMTVNGITMNVTCSGTKTVGQQNTRTVTFSACQSGLGTCTSSSSALVAQVAFQDYSAAGIYRCTSSPDSATCGTGDMILSWIVQTSNH